MREKKRALAVTVVLLCLSAAVVLYSLNTGTLNRGNDASVNWSWYCGRHFAKSIS